MGIVRTVVFCHDHPDGPGFDPDPAETGRRDLELAPAPPAGVFAAVYDVTLWSWKGPPTVLGGMVAADRFAVFARIVLLAVAAIGVAFGYHYFRRTGEPRRAARIFSSA